MALITDGRADALSETLRLHPDAPARFLWRGAPRFLLGSTEHYGAVLNTAFDYERYLDTIAADGLSLTRANAFFRELPDSLDGWLRGANTLAPSPGDYLAPWARSEEVGATGPDWMPRFDLDVWDDRYFARLRAFIDAAARRDVIVELVLFGNPYTDTQWRFVPLSPLSNINAVGSRVTACQQYMTLHDPSIEMHQRRFVSKVAFELNACDNVYFEICNEPSLGPAPGSAAPEPHRLREWQQVLIDEFHDAERPLANRHLVAVNPHMDVPIEPVSGPEHRRDSVLDDATYWDDPGVSIVNVHYVSQRETIDGVVQRFSDATRDPASYRLGNIAAFVAARSPLRKALSFDEDYTGIAFGFAPRPAQNRLEAWESLLAGCAAYDHLDFTFTPSDPTGSAAGTPPPDVPGSWFDGRPLRRQLSYLASFAASIDLTTLSLDRAAIERMPAGTDSIVARDAGGSLVALVVDRRPIGAGFGEADLGGSIALRVGLARGRYRVRSLDPKTGSWTELAAAGTTPAGLVRIEVPPFREDVVLHVVPGAR